jgi:hypothetical protein
MDFLKLKQIYSKMDPLVCGCPYCGYESEIVIDMFDGQMDLASDCENCCRPFYVHVLLEAGQVVECCVQC